jgi:hypothetical protein
VQLRRVSRNKLAQRGADDLSIRPCLVHRIAA